MEFLGSLVFYCLLSYPLSRVYCEDRQRLLCSTNEDLKPTPPNLNSYKSICFVLREPTTPISFPPLAATISLPSLQWGIWGWVMVYCAHFSMFSSVLSFYVAWACMLHSSFPTAMASFRPGRNETDRLALLAFKAKITYDPSRILRSWNGSIHFGR